MIPTSPGACEDEGKECLGEHEHCAWHIVGAQETLSVLLPAAGRAPGPRNGFGKSSESLSLGD